MISVCGDSIGRSISGIFAIEIDLAVSSRGELRHKEISGFDV
jgi:hypothetical protein